MRKNYIIIGGNSAMAKSLIRKELDADNQIYAISRQKIEESHPHLKSRIADIVNDDVPADFFPERVDGLVYFPGTIKLKPFRSLKEQDFLEDFSIHFLGAVKIIQFLHRRLSDQSSIILFSSVAARLGLPYHASVAASKAAVESLALTLAAELAPKVRVNVIAPSLTESGMSEQLLNNPEKRSKMNARHPLGRFGQPEDIASLASFLLSDQAQWITGQVIPVDGGFTNIRQ